MPVEQIIGLLASILGIADQVVKLAEAAERNREKCKQLSGRVKMIMGLMRVLHKIQWTPNPMMNNMLGSLEAALNDGKDLVESCQKKRTWSRVFKTQKKARKIDALDLRISKILEQFHIANMILIVSMNKECFFMNVLEKLLQDGACCRLPQSIKEELKSSIRSLSDTDNMSSDAKRVLELLIRELAHGDVGGCASSLRPGGCGGKQKALTNGDALTTDIISRVAHIVDGARRLRQNRDEIQQLARLVQQVGELIEDPQYSELLRDPNLRPMLDRLKLDLDQAYMIILHNARPHANKITRVILCGVDAPTSSSGYTWQQPEEILKVAYKIEYYVHVLPFITMPHISQSLPL